MRKSECAKVEIKKFYAYLCLSGVSRMAKMSKFILPYEPEYVGHHDADRQQRETKEWLRKRESELTEGSPSIVPKQAPEKVRSV
jgi:hypothetical protein